MKARLEFRVGQNQKILDVIGTVTIGRDKTCEVMTDDPRASRKHARIYTDGNQFLLEDLHSRNGTYLNGTKISGKTPLKHGDTVQIGQFTIKFLADATVHEQSDSSNIPQTTHAPACQRAGYAQADHVCAQFQLAETAHAKRRETSGALASILWFIIFCAVAGGSFVISREFFLRVL